MKINLMKSATILAFVLCLAFSANAQRRKTNEQKERPNQTAATKTMNAVEIKSGADKF